jgi:hypothetical protein
MNEDRNKGGLFQFTLARMSVATALVCVGLGLLSTAMSFPMRTSEPVVPAWVHILLFISVPAFGCAGIASLMPKSVSGAILAGVVGWLCGFFLGFPLFALWAMTHC